MVLVGGPEAVHDERAEPPFHTVAAKRIDVPRRLSWTANAGSERRSGAPSRAITPWAARVGRGAGLRLTPPAAGRAGLPSNDSFFTTSRVVTEASSSEMPNTSTYSGAIEAVTS